MLASALFAAAALAATAAEPADNWSALCAACHGKDGTGNTRAGKKLGVKDLTADTQKAFTDAEAFAALKNGLTAPDGTQKMKPFADKVTDDEIKALVGYVRTLAK
jgi:mono/diheme cytochrome c family protein